MPRPRGRPRKKESERRSEQMAIRFTKSLRKRLEAACRESGNTLTREIEGRLIQSFESGDQKDLFGSAHTRRFFQLVAEGISLIEEFCSFKEVERRSWLQDRYTFDQVVEMIRILHMHLQPPGESRKPSRGFTGDLLETDRGRRILEVLERGGEGLFVAGTITTAISRLIPFSDDGRISVEQLLGPDVAKVLNLAAVPLGRRIKHADQKSFTWPSRQRSAAG
jgi:hypothetical protein